MIKAVIPGYIMREAIPPQYCFTRMPKLKLAQPGPLNILLSCLYGSYVPMDALAKA